MALYFDGPYVAGAPIITIAGITYKCNSFSTDRDSTQVNVNDNNGEHDGGVNFLGPITGSMELQAITSTTTSYPVPVSQSTTFGQFTLNSATYFITKVSAPQPAQNIWTFNVDFQKRDNV